MEPIKPIIKLQAWQDQFIEFLADPSDDRTIKAFCTDVAVPYSTLALWKKDNRQMIYTEADRRRKTYDAVIRTEAYKNLYKRMSKSDFAVQNALKLLGDLVERQEIKTGPLTTEQKRERAREILEKLSKKIEAAEGNSGEGSPS